MVCADEGDRHGPDLATYAPSPFRCVDMKGFLHSPITLAMPGLRYRQRRQLPRFTLDSQPSMTDTDPQ